MTSPAPKPAVCVPNIGIVGRRRRWQFGAALLAAGVGIAALLVATGAPRVWRLALFLPFWVGALGVLQAREKT
jgi:hypothetical protein